MLKPRRLRPGDRVAIVAPASPFSRDQFDAGVAELVRLGFEPAFDSSVFERRGYVAGDASLRAAAVRAALHDPGVGAIIAARGGYGSVQILPLLDPRELREAGKAIVGYSDVTSLLAFVSGTCGLACFHGPTVAGRLGRGRDGYDEDSFLRSLTRSQPAGVAWDQAEVLAAGEARGPLHGGNLTQVAASQGTPYAFRPPRGSIVLLEDVNERPYRLDRLWTQLRLAGVFDGAAGIAFGDFPGCDEPGGEVTAASVLSELVRDFPGPVIYGLPVGHTRRPALTIPLGVTARIVAATRGALIIDEAAVD